MTTHRQQQQQLLLIDLLCHGIYPQGVMQRTGYCRATTNKLLKTRAQFYGTKQNKNDYKLVEQKAVRRARNSNKITKN